MRGKCRSVVAKHLLSLCFALNQDSIVESPSTTRASLLQPRAWICVSSRTSVAAILCMTSSATFMRSYFTYNSGDGFCASATMLAIPSYYFYYIYYFY